MRECTQNRFVVALLGLVSACVLVGCASTSTNSAMVFTAARIHHTLLIDGQIDASWGNATPLDFASDWQGRPTATHTRVRALWTSEVLYLLWELDGADLQNTDHRYSIVQERDKLYDEDCVELFIAPNPAMPYQYAEVEAGPYGHFLDLWIDRRANQFMSDWSAGVEVATTQDVAAKRAVIEMAIRAPELIKGLVADARLPIGLYRIEGVQPRQYLAAFPTRTRIPNFHVPDAFGTLVLSP